jgi:hypothetical protein
MTPQAWTEPGDRFDRDLEEESEPKPQPTKPAPGKIENLCCIDCPMVLECRNLSRRHRKRKIPKSGYVQALVKFAVLHGASMKCLTGGEL